MNGDRVLIHVLIIEDDKDTQAQIADLLPDALCEVGIIWEQCLDFDEAIEQLNYRRYDLVVSDIYRDREGRHKNIAEGDIRASSVVEVIRSKRFCPIVLISDGTVPDGLLAEPFVNFADKSDPTGFETQLKSKIEDHIRTGIPVISRKLHDDLDRFAGSYLWQFLSDAWGNLKDSDQGDAEILERIIRRRAALQLDRLNPSDADNYMQRKAEPADYYLMPPIGNDIHLGSVLRRKDRKEYRVVLTPHCHLATQPGAAAARVETILTAVAVPAKEQIAASQGKDPWPKKDPKVLDALRRRIQVPAQLAGCVSGSHCFLPGFLDVPDLYCNLISLESLDYGTVQDQFDNIATIDAPFAEAIQSCLVRLYSAVGLPNLNPERFRHLGPNIGD